MHNRRSYYTYLLIEGLSSLFFYIIITVNMVYQVEVAHLNPLQLVLVGTALETVVFFCEVPTGIIADVYSRRMAVILGLMLFGVGFILEGAIPRFETILLSQALWGIGATFMNGAEEAWIADEVGEESVGKVYLRGAQFAQFGALIGAGISVALASIRLNLPILIGGGLYLVLACALIFLMPEHSFRPERDKEHNTWKAITDTFRACSRLVRVRPLLITLLAISAFDGLASEGFDRLWTAHFLTNFTFPALGSLKPVVWFGLMRAGSMILSIVGAEIVKRYINTDKHSHVKGLLFSLYALQITCIVIFALAGNFILALCLYWSISMIRQTLLPVYMAWLTQQIDSKVRATVLSMSGQLNAIGQIVGGPIVGAIGTLVSLRAALMATASLLTPNLLLTIKAKQEELQQKEEETPLVETPV